MCRPAALAAWLGGRAAVEKRLPNQGMCCLFYTQNPLWWTGLAAVCLLPVVLAAAMPVWQSILLGKSVLFVFGSLVPFLWWVGNQLLMHACGAIMGTRAAVLAFVKGLLQGQWLR